MDRPVVSERICLVDADGADQIGTVRFYGTVAPWPTSDCVGIEWDDAANGKNNGSLEYQGVKYEYFDTQGGLASGSFIKLRKTVGSDGEAKLSRGRRLVWRGRSFWEAVQYRYNELELLGMQKEVKLGTKSIEQCGMDELILRKAQLESLEVVSLDGMHVNNSVGIDEPLGGLLPNVRSLDLGYNLMSSWEAAVGVARALPALETLALSGNRWRFDGTTKPNDRLLVLRMSSCGLGLLQPSAEAEEWTNAIAAFSGLRTLDLANNRLAELPGLSLPQLTDLDLSYNEIEGPLDVSCVALRQLHSLSLRDNAVSEIVGGTNTWIKRLDLTNNSVASWGAIERLGRALPGLESLKITGNPVFKDGSDDYDMSLIQTVSLLPSLTSLNGTAFSQEQRTNYELYYIGKAKAGELAKPSQGVWRALLGRHGQEDASEPVSSVAARDSTLDVKVVCSRPFSVRLFPHTTTVGKLRGKISRKLGLNILDFAITTGTDVIDNEMQLVSDTSIPETLEVTLHPTPQQPTNL